MKGKARLAALMFFCLTGFALQNQAQYHKNITLEGHLPYNECLSAIWGYTAPDLREYAIVGTCSGTSVVDINDPGNPQQKLFIPGPPSIWREMKVWDNHAYIVTEGGNGLTIVDLSHLPDTVLNYTIYNMTGPVGAEMPLTNVHTIWIDEHGHCFLYGATNFGGGLGAGCIMLDLNTDPMHPTYITVKPGLYYHDGYVRGDTLWAAAIYDGLMEVWDMGNPTEPVFLGNRPTPANFTHNTWLSTDGKTIFTTDEVADAVVAAYDVTDLSNIKELDRIQQDPNGNEVPHNVHYLNGWLPTAYYREGAVIIDAHKPDNMVIVGYYDTFFPDTGSVFGGVWEVYPFFRSGRMIAGDRKNGLFILKPNYVRAAYLEGTVTDTVTSQPIPGASIFFSGFIPGDTLLSKIDGTYKTGAADSGLYLLEFVAAGYESKKMYVTLDNAETVIQDAKLRPIGYIVPAPPEDFSELKIFPVPTSSDLQITGIPFDITEVQLADVNGKIIHSRKLNSSAYITMDVSNYAVGTYFLFFRKGNKKAKAERIVIVR